MTLYNLAPNILLQLVKKVFRCCENLSYNWFQKLLGYSRDELNGTTNCSMAQYEVFRCCGNLSCNWLQKLLGYNGNELNGTTNCTGKLLRY